MTTDPTAHDHAARWPSCLRARVSALAPPLLVAAVASLVVRQVAVAWVLSGRWPNRMNAVIAVVASSLLLVAPAFALRGRARVVALLAGDVVAGGLLVLLLLYHRQFADLPSAQSLSYATQAVGVGNPLGALLRWPDPLLFVGGGLLALCFPALRRERVRLAPRAARWLAVGAAVVTVAAMASSSAVRDGGTWDRTLMPRRIGPLGYCGHEVVRHVMHRIDRRLGPDEAQVAADRALLAARREAEPRAALFGAARGANVIVVQLESLQGFAAGLSVGGRPLTPSLDALARESLRFGAFHAQVAQGNTADAELASQCSLHPPRTGAAFFALSGDDLRCLPEVLRDHGYTTAVLHANGAHFWNREQVYPLMGVDRWIHAGFFAPDHADVVTDEAFLGQAVDKLAALPSPFQAVLITLSSHLPFDHAFVPTVLDHGPRRGSFEARYLDALHYTDAQLGRFVAALRDRGLLDRSILVVYGDHGGLFRRNSTLQELLGLPDVDPVRWFTAERRVPLLVRLPGGAARGDVDRVVGQVDLAPTVLSLLGIPRDGTAFLGADMLAERPGYVALSNGSASSDTHLWVTADGGFGPPGCYRRADGAGVAEAECAALVARARGDLALSWRMLDEGAVARVAGVAPSAAPAPLAPAAAGVQARR